MPRKPFRSLLGIASKSNSASVILVSNTFIWYFTVLYTLQPVLEKSFWGLFAHFAALILAAFAGASIAKHVERIRFIVLWMILGVSASIMLFALGSSSEILLGSVSLFLGFALGFGMPACMSYFTESGSVATRGRASGLTLLVSGIGIVAFRFLEINNFFMLGLILGIWRLSGLLVFLWARNRQMIVREQKTLSYKDMLRQRSFTLYFVPWIMFSCVNYIAAPMESNFSTQYPILVVVQFLSMSIAAITGGVFIDSMGRKPAAIAGFAMLGLGTAFVGFFGTAEIVLYFNALIDGIAWGFLLVLFIMTLWGDMSHNYSSEKYYALGVMPFFFSKLLEITILPRIFESTITYSVLFSFTAFFLFLAVLPLFYAPETLPEKIVKEKELIVYVEKAQEVAQKYY